MTIIVLCSDGLLRPDPIRESDERTCRDACESHGEIIADLLKRVRALEESRNAGGVCR